MALRRSMLTRTSGGSRETEEKEFTVMPWGGRRPIHHGDDGDAGGELGAGPAIELGTGCQIGRTGPAPLLDIEITLILSSV